MFKSSRLSFKPRRSPRHDEQVLALALKQIEKMLKEMQDQGKELSKLKLKKFQKTHHIDCRCRLCCEAKSKDDPRLKGLLEDGFKVYIEGSQETSWSPAGEARSLQKNSLPDPAVLGGTFGLVLFWHGALEIFTLQLGNPR